MNKFHPALLLWLLVGAAAPASSSDAESGQQTTQYCQKTEAMQTRLTAFRAQPFGMQRRLAEGGPAWPAPASSIGFRRFSDFDRGGELVGADGDPTTGTQERPAQRTSRPETVAYDIGRNLAMVGEMVFVAERRNRILLLNSFRENES